MMDWLLNPYGIDIGAYVVLWVAMLAIIPVSLVVGIVQAIRQHNRESGDSLPDTRGGSQ